MEPVVVVVAGVVGLLPVDLIGGDPGQVAALPVLIIDIVAHVEEVAAVDLPALAPGVVVVEPRGVNRADSALGPYLEVAGTPSAAPPSSPSATSPCAAYQLLTGEVLLVDIRSE